MVMVNLKKILEYGILAPSVHNVQPWQFKIDKDMVTISISNQRRLGVGDPVGRETWLSIGACLENIIQSAAIFGQYVHYKLHDSEVLITFSNAKPPKPEITLETIQKRFTDRSKYNGKAVPKATLNAIQNCWQSEDISLVVTYDPEVIRVVSDLTARGISLALRQPAFRQELSGLINRPFSSKQTGFSYRSLRLKPLRAVVEPLSVGKGLNITKQVKKERSLWLSSSALIMTFAKGDSIKYWLEAGRAYQRAGLIAVQHDLRQATSAAIVEASDFHTDIENLVGTDLRLETLMRIGYSSAKPAHSPRLRLDDVIVT